MERYSGRKPAARLENADSLVQDFLARGGQITQCPPGDATLTKAEAATERAGRAAAKPAAPEGEAEAEETPG